MKTMLKYRSVAIICFSISLLCSATSYADDSVYGIYNCSFYGWISDSIEHHSEGTLELFEFSGEPFVSMNVHAFEKTDAFTNENYHWTAKNKPLILDSANKKISFEAGFWIREVFIFPGNPAEVTVTPQNFERYFGDITDNNTIELRQERLVCKKK